MSLLQSFACRRRRTEKIKMTLASLLRNASWLGQPSGSLRQPLQHKLTNLGTAKATHEATLTSVGVIPLRGHLTFNSILQTSRRLTLGPTLEGLLLPIWTPERPRPRHSPKPEATPEVAPPSSTTPLRLVDDVGKGRRNRNTTARYRCSEGWNNVEESQE